MIKSKLLTDSTWKDVLAKNKSVKDNGLLKTLAEIKKLGDDAHDDAQKALDEVLKLAAQLKKSKEIAAVPAVSKFLAELASAADTAARDVAKAKAEADKRAKAAADVARKRKADDEDEVDEDEDDEASVLLGTKLVPLLRMVAKGQTMHALVAKSGKRVAVMLSRKPIPPARRKLLAEQLGGGSTKYYPGHCALEGGRTTFVLQAEVAGMAKLIKAALLEQTGLRLPKVKARGDDGDDDDDDEGGDDVPPFVPGVDIEDDDARREYPLKGDDGPAEYPLGEDGPAEYLLKGDDDGPAEYPTGVEIKEAPPGIEQAPLVWKGTRKLLQTNIDALKQAVREQIAGEADGFIVEIDGHLHKIDRILQRLDKRLFDSLTYGAETTDPGERSAALKKSKVILAEYIRYVGSEPLIEHLDANPFGVRTDLKATLTKSLTQLTRAIG